MGDRTCTRYSVLREWPLLGLDEIHSASTHGQRECALEGARAVKSTLCPQGVWSIPSRMLGLSPIHNSPWEATPASSSQGHFLQWSLSFYTRTGTVPLAPPHTHLILLGLILPTGLPGLWAAGSGLGLCPSPSCLQAAAYHPWADGNQWPDCRKSEDWGQFPSLPGLATVPVVRQICNSYYL